MAGPFVLLAVLSLAPAEKSSLPPEAHAHNRVAMAHYDAGRLEEALVEFQAAYDAMPDIRRDRERRDRLIDSMHFTLVMLHERDGSPGPLCRIAPLLEAHIAGLTAAFPERPEFGVIKFAGAQQRLKERLAAFPPDVCQETPVAAPPLEPASAPVAPAPPPVTPAPAPTTTPPEQPPPARAGRGSLVAGGLLLPLGVAALTGLGVVASRHRRAIHEGEALHDALATRPDTATDRTRMRELVAATRRDEGLMVALGVTGGALVTAATALLLRGQSQRRRARPGFDVRANRVGLTIAGEF